MTTTCTVCGEGVGELHVGTVTRMPASDCPGDWEPGFDKGPEAWLCERCLRPYDAARAAMRENMGVRR